MKKISSLFSLYMLLFLALSQVCNATPTSDSGCCCGSQVTLEGKVSAFFPFSHRVREIYADVWPNYGLELSYISPYRVGGWIGVDYTEHKGHSISEGDRTRLMLVPATLGIKYNQKFQSWLEGYAGLGIICGWVKIHDHSPFVTRHLHKTAVGGIVKAGINFYPMTHLLLDLFVDYQYLKFTFHNRNFPFVERTNLNMSGLRVGLGVGIKF
ncbi:MAG: hypothetical protein ACRDDW_05460 [Candidatus Rhabdochlamydia sp.]